jgi:hypothetical protein
MLRRALMECEAFKQSTFARTSRPSFPPIPFEHFPLHGLVFSPCFRSNGGKEPAVVDADPSAHARRLSPCCLLSECITCMSFPR